MNPYLHRKQRRLRSESNSCMHTSKGSSWSGHFSQVLHSFPLRGLALLAAICYYQPGEGLGDSIPCHKKSTRDLFHGTPTADHLTISTSKVSYTKPSLLVTPCWVYLLSQKNKQASKNPFFLFFSSPEYLLLNCGLWWCGRRLNLRKKSLISSFFWYPHTPIWSESIWKKKKGKKVDYINKQEENNNRYPAILLTQPGTVLC